MLCEDRGAILKVIPMNHRGELLLEDYVSLLTSRTRLVAVTHVSNALGTINPIKQMSQMAHHVGAKILVDGAQSAPHFKIDVQDLDADFFVFSGHKIMGPTGIGILYGKSEWLHQMLPYQGGGDMVDKVTFAKTIYRPPPLKFEAGTPMSAEVVGLGAALNYMQSLGLDNIQKWERELVQYATAQLMRIPGLKIIGTAAEKGSLISFVVDGVHALDLGTLLDLKGFAIRTGHHCAQPVMDFFRVPATARVSFACFNTKEEIDNFVITLESVIDHLKK
jgi:cysteine desulfurase / selenocysteine lyase